MRFKFGNTLTTTVTLDISNSRQMCQHVYKSCKYSNQLLPASSCTTDNPSLFYDQCSFGIKSPNAFNVDGKFELQSTWICGQNGIIKTSYKYSAGCPDGFLQTKHLNANKGCERLIANFLFGKCDLSRDNAKFQNPTLPKLLQDTFPYVCNNGQDNSNKLVVVIGCLRYQTTFANALTPDKTCVASKSHFFRKCDFHVAENYRWVNPQNKLLSLITSDCDDDGKRSPEKVLLVKGCPKPTSVTPTRYSLDHKCTTTNSLYFESCLAIAMPRWLFTVNSSFQDEVCIGCDNGKSNVTRLDLIPCNLFLNISLSASKVCFKSRSCATKRSLHKI
ncbi:hypothetical protein MHBO_003005 [Bonamia ostreae]|uniref:Uncharacterized protein n=1 Tax=Bonamia ostreae TaxID=126728 RepID=A0ABV2AP70_9EUKA